YTVYVCIVFFFSSRRRHTRSTRDWSSDVCSSDLCLLGSAFLIGGQGRCSFAINKPQQPAIKRTHTRYRNTYGIVIKSFLQGESRSEERRVGKECRYRSAERYEEETVNMIMME